MQILFVCCGNTCRSVLAEYLARRRYPNVVFQSAGISPGSVKDAENAVYTLKNLGIDASNHRPRSIETVDLAQFDRIIAMDKSIGAWLIQQGVDKAKLLIWKIRDPFGNDLAEYELRGLEISRELSKLLRTLMTVNFAKLN
jgi:protein-tyrosine-phosphatase